MYVYWNNIKKTRFYADPGKEINLVLILIKNDLLYIYHLCC